MRQRAHMVGTFPRVGCGSARTAPLRSFRRAASGTSDTPERAQSMHRPVHTGMDEQIVCTRPFHKAQQGCTCAMWDMVMDMVCPAPMKYDLAHELPFTPE